MDDRIYSTMTGVSLAGRWPHDLSTRFEEPAKPAPFTCAMGTGAAVGFVSELSGVGGGVFLAPIMIGLHWASPKQTMALSPPFILANSAVALAGTWYAGQVAAGDAWLYALDPLT